MFFGEYEYKLEQKGRLPIPPKFKREFKDGMVLLPGVEPCITVYTPSEWKKVSAEFTTGSINRSKMRKLNRALFASAFYLSLDGQGRVALPVPLREHAGIEIEEEVVVAGANTYLELWSKDNWEQEKADSQAQAWQIIESLERQ